MNSVTKSDSVIAFHCSYFLSTCISLFHLAFQPCQRNIFALFNGHFNSLLCIFKQLLRLTAKRSRLINLSNNVLFNIISQNWYRHIKYIFVFYDRIGSTNIEAQKPILLKISNGVEPHDICILCKQKPQDYASAIIEELEKHGVRARIETGYQDLIKEPIVDLFIKFMICADSRKHPNEWTFIEELLVELWGISGMRENDTFDEMQRKLSAVVNVVKKNIQQKLDTEQWHSTLNSIIDFFGIGNIKAKFPAYKQGTYFMNVINQFESLFFEEYVAAHGVWNLAIENFRGDHSVPIMTIHKSKGLEYNAVYFIGLEDSAFWNFRNQPDEDRCTFFVALSRAKASVTFTFCKKRSGMKCPMQRHNAINEFFDLLQRPGIAEVKRFQNR